MVRVARLCFLFCCLRHTDGSPWAGVGWERTVSYPLAENCCSFLVKVLIYCYKPLPSPSFIGRDKLSAFVSWMIQLIFLVRQLMWVVLLVCRCHKIY